MSVQTSSCEPFVALGHRAIGARPGGAFHRVVTVARHLSFDVVAGVLAAAAFAVSVTGARVPSVFWWLLPLATWTIYTVDHLLDARGAERELHTPRHRFHRRNARPLLLLMVGAAGAGLAAALAQLPGDLWSVAGWVCLASVVHLSLAQSPAAANWPKELSAAAIYSAGIWFVPLYRGSAGSWVVLLLSLHGLAALLNLLMLGIYERRADLRDGHGSAVRSWGEPAVRRAVSGLTLVGAAAALATCAFGPDRLRPAAVVIVLLVGLPWCMLRRPRWFRPHGRYRSWGDLSFCLLVLPWIIDGWWSGVG